jgi:hypothetical protein
MPRPQFTIRTLLWLMLVVAVFLGGMLLGRDLARREYGRRPTGSGAGIIWEASPFDSRELEIEFPLGAEFRLSSETQKP